MAGRPPSPSQSEAQRAHAEAERQRYQSLAPADRRAIVVERDREAQRVADRRRRAKDPEARNESARRSRTAAAARRRGNPEEESAHQKRIKAQALARVAKATGTIKTPARCERCGKVPPTQMHHENYDKPLEVSHLCAQCHGEAHRAGYDEPHGLPGRVSK